MTNKTACLQNKETIKTMKATFMTNFNLNQV